MTSEDRTEMTRWNVNVPCIEMRSTLTSIEMRCTQTSIGMKSTQTSIGMRSIEMTKKNALSTEMISTGKKTNALSTEMINIGKRMNDLSTETIKMNVRPTLTHVQVLLWPESTVPPSTKIAKTYMWPGCHEVGQKTT
jgi:hypothetical protein